MTARGWPLLFGAATVASIAAEIVFHDAAHALFWWHATPAFDLGLGFAGSVAIAGVSKALGKWLLRPDTYYDEDRR